MAFAPRQTPWASSISLAAGATVWKQAIGLGGAIAWSAISTLIVLGVCNLTTGLRVTREQEIEGLDYALHGETLHD